MLKSEMVIGVCGHKDDIFISIGKERDHKTSDQRQSFEIFKVTFIIFHYLIDGIRVLILSLLNKTCFHKQASTQVQMAFFMHNEKSILSKMRVKFNEHKFCIAK